MSVIIHGMNMPKSCDECRLFNECWCMALGIENWRKSYNKPPEGERLPDCPLVPLSEGHGRLMDAERFRVILCRLKERQNDDVATHALNWAIECLDKLDTIVPAEGGTEDGN